MLTAGGRLTSHIWLCRDRDGPGRLSLRSDLLDLAEFQFHRRRAAEDRHRDLHARTALVDFLDYAVERGERAVGDAHVLADLERDRRLRTLNALLHLLQDAAGLGFRDRHRLVVGAKE